MDNSITIDGEGIGLHERGELARVNKEDAPVVRQRRFFRGYHIAFATFAGVFLIELVSASMIGGIIFAKNPIDLLKIGNYLDTLPGWFLLPLIWIGIATYQIVKRRSDRPTLLLLRLVRFRSDWLIRGMLVLATLPATAKSFGIMKASIPYIRPYYLDPILLKVDLSLFGVDAWKAAAAIAPDRYLVSIDRLYFLWFTYLVIVTGVFSFTKNPKLQIKGALAFQLIWFILGVCAATGLASVGPVFYDMIYGGSHFADLTTRLRSVHESEGLIAVNAMDFLVRSIGTTNLGSGISAMPSMHVSMAFFGFLIACQFPYRSFKIITLVFTILILFGSVRLGWHYMSDGVVGILGVALIWKGVAWFVDWTYREAVVSKGGSMAISHIHPFRKDQVG